LFFWFTIFQYKKSDILVEFVLIRFYTAVQLRPSPPKLLSSNCWFYAIT